MNWNATRKKLSSIFLWEKGGQAISLALNSMSFCIGKIFNSLKEIKKFSKLNHMTILLAYDIKSSIHMLGV